MFSRWSRTAASTSRLREASRSRKEQRYTAEWKMAGRRGDWSSKSRETDETGTGKRSGGILKVLREEGAPTETYARYLGEGRLAFQHCTGCGRAVFYPRVLCPYCGSTSLEWRESSGRGTVYAATAIYHRDREPHNVALVDLDEGFRIMSRVEGIAAEEVQIGMRVSFEAREEEGEPVAVFLPEEG
jgi:uncharacterized protein